MSKDYGCRLYDAGVCSSLSAGHNTETSTEENLVIEIFFVLAKVDNLIKVFETLK